MKKLVLNLFSNFYFVIMLSIFQLIPKQVQAMHSSTQYINSQKQDIINGELREDEKLALVFYEMALKQFILNSEEKFTQKQYDYILENFMDSYINSDSWNDKKWDEFLVRVSMTKEQYIEVMVYFTNALNEYTLLNYTGQYENFYDIAEKYDVQAVMDYLVNVYLKAFDRKEIDSDGFNYWISRIFKEEVSIEEFILTIIDTEEFINISKTTEDKIKRLYSVIFKRDADEEGLEFWIKEFDNDFRQTRNNKESLKNVVLRMIETNEFELLITGFGFNKLNM